MNLAIVEKKKNYAVVKLNRPEIHNAFNDELINELKNIFTTLQKDENVRLVVLTGEGKSFCAGADLNWMKSMVNYSEAENKKDSKNLESLFDTINEFSKPVIGRINGHALGGGVGLLSVCDYVLAVDSAKLGFTEVRLGLIPAVISPYVMAKIGESHARAWFLSGERFDASKGFQMGLVHEIVSSSDLDKRTDAVVESFFKAGPHAAQVAKNLIKEVIGTHVSELADFTTGEIAKMRVSEEGQEGMNAMLEKRNASWLK